jgi:hypothetical protein
MTLFMTANVVIRKKFGKMGHIMAAIIWMMISVIVGKRFRPWLRTVGTVAISLLIAIMTPILDFLHAVPYIAMRIGMIVIDRLQVDLK